MTPDLTIIFFTTASGAGYGLLFWLGLLAPLGVLPMAGSFGATASIVGLALVSAGFLSSTFHVSHKKRAWRAITQWRTSWLSREAVAALLTYIPAMLFPVLWWIDGHPGELARLLGFLTAALSAVTVACTGMIYASLKPIRQWCHPIVLPVYLLASAFSGAACLAAIATLWQAPGYVAYGAVMLAGVTLIAKLGYWRSIDRGAPRGPGDAIGLARLGSVRMLDPPNTEENYLLREMGYRVARKHATKLRIIAIILAFVLPIILLPFVPLLAAILSLLGLLVERWLFFAEATHTVTLYYGRTA